MDQFLLGFMTGLMLRGATDQEAARAFQEYIHTDEDNCPLEGIKNRYYKLKVLYIETKRDIWPVSST